MDIEPHHSADCSTCTVQRVKIAGGEANFAQPPEILDDSMHRSYNPLQTTLMHVIDSPMSLRADHVYRVVPAPALTNLVRWRAENLN